ncbi:hypothetical protein PHSY_005709 [Pseudozyma hubeiensis SY62]|uniref:Uncharacterized protein n=1 Tax=Pseudozyma hubeiensis (strain SY62) TaxID=1305764 RepID=R9PJ13_PSEHS|nr:hypothetical protein PHSY_005709 [Pseudozyma hubeiensis SY62]GAC98120.1 hypothetical protein PHSY_005709 [Pseudozyma hubeiensis SY62]
MPFRRSLVVGFDPTGDLSEIHLASGSHHVAASTDFGTAAKCTQMQGQEGGASLSTFATGMQSSAHVHDTTPTSDRKSSSSICRSCRASSSVFPALGYRVLLAIRS